MTDNEKRAHDLALLITGKHYDKYSKEMGDRLTGIVDAKLMFDFADDYEKNYQEVKLSIDKYFNE